MASIGNPQDLLTTPYGYSGQMSPEAAIAEQALNRRRLLANMLTQQGLQPAQGKMVGRFYVPASPLQGGAGLAQVLAGSLGNRMIDNEQADIIKKDQAVPAEAIAAWRKKMSEPVPAQQAAAPIPPPPQEAPATLAPSTGGEQPASPMQTLGPRPQDLPDQHTGVSNYRAPAFVGTHPSGISTEVTPGDMSTMVNSADPNKGLDQLGGQVATQPQAPPPMAPAPAPQAAPRKVTMDDLAELMTHQHPLVRAYGAMQLQQMNREQDQARADQHRQEDLGMKMLEHNTPSGSAKLMSEAQQASTREANALRIQAMTQQHEDQQAVLNENRRHFASQEAFNEAKMRLDERQARERNALEREKIKADKEIAGMKAQQKGELPAPSLAKQDEELTAIQTAAGVKSNIGAIRDLISTGQLKLGPMENLLSQGKNYAGMSDQNSRNYDSLKTALEQMRNDTLILQKGVQTEGDAKRAMNALLSNPNDAKNVEQQLKIIEEKNAQAIELRKQRINALRKNHNAPQFDFSPYENVQPLGTFQQGGNSAPKTAGPQAGMVEDGYRFKGGNPADPNAWEKVK